MSNIVMFCKLFSCSTLQSPSKEHVNNEAVQVGVASDQCWYFPGPGDPGCHKPLGWETWETQDVAVDTRDLIHGIVASFDSGVGIWKSLCLPTSIISSDTPDYKEFYKDPKSLDGQFQFALSILFTCVDYLKMIWLMTSSLTSLK